MTLLCVEQAKARRLGISLEEARERDREQRPVLAEDPRITSGSQIEADYGKRSGQYAWQRDKEEVKRKAEEAKARAASGGKAMEEQAVQSDKPHVAID